MSQAVLRLTNLAPGTYSIRFTDFVITASAGNYWINATTLGVSTVAPNGNYSNVGLIIAGTTVSVDAGNSSLSCWSYIDVAASGVTYTVYDDSNPNPSGGGTYINGFWAGGFSLLLAEVGTDVFEDVVLVLNIDDGGDELFPGAAPSVPDTLDGDSTDPDNVDLTWNADADAWTNIEMSISADIGWTPWASVFVAPPTIQAATIGNVEDTILNAIEEEVLESQVSYDVYFRAKSFLLGVSDYSAEWSFVYSFSEPPVPPTPDIDITPDDGPGGGLGWLDAGGAALIVFMIDPSGIYTIVPGRHYDTIYERLDVDTRDVAIPEPYGITGYLGE